ncbi:class I adenylate-forming enzyme family protein [Leucobacter sp. BZR 635]
MSTSQPNPVITAAMLEHDPVAASLPALLAQQAARIPSREFLRFGSDSFTFAEVDALTSQLAHWLLNAGILPGARVAIMLGNELGWPATWLAALKAGITVVPINSHYQASDLAYVLHDSGARLIVTSSAHLALVEPVAAEQQQPVRVITAAELFTEASGLPQTSPQVGVASDTVANFQYTSGTTGFPKACILTNEYWLRIGWLAAGLAALEETDVVLTAQPFSYMDPQWNTAMALTAGVPLVVLERFSASGFWPSVREHGATVFYILGTMPMLLLKQPEHPLDLENQVRLVLCSGIPQAHHAELERRWGAPWREAFGMTETGVDLISPVSDTDTVGTGALGLPVPGKQVDVRDAQGRSVAADEIGELVVSGTPMMVGYWNNPEATAATIVDGWAHTGDLVRRDDRGRLFLVGRLKEMIRRGGENISSAEVEAVMSGNPLVVSCAAVGEPDELWGEEVKLFVKLAPGIPASRETAVQLDEHARAHLAKFKTPSQYSFVDEFPLTPSLRISKPLLVAEAAAAGLPVFSTSTGPATPTP